MPYSSRAQQGYMHAAMSRGEIKPSVVHEFDKSMASGGLATCPHCGGQIEGPSSHESAAEHGSENHGYAEGGFVDYPEEMHEYPHPRSAAHMIGGDEETYGAGGTPRHYSEGGSVLQEHYGADEFGEESPEEEQREETERREAARRMIGRMMRK